MRKRISARKVKPHEWLGVMREAQLLGMPTTATMMFGSIETAEERIEHMHVLRELQDETGGFTAFIPWYYVPFKTPLRGKEATALEYLRVLAVSRLYLDNFPHLQASWLTPGAEDGPARAVLRLRRHGRHDHRRARRARRRQQPTKRRAAISKTLVIGAGFNPVIRDTYWNARPDMALACSSSP